MDRIELKTKILPLRLLIKTGLQNADNNEDIVNEGDGLSYILGMSQHKVLTQISKCPVPLIRRHEPTSEVVLW